MRTTTKLVAALSVVALLGVGLAAAQDASDTTDPSASAGDGGGNASGPAHQHQGWLAKLRARLAFWHKHPVQAMDKVCDGNMTVDECKALVKDKLQELKGKVQAKAQQLYEQCLAKRSKDYCDGRLDQFKADHPRLYGNQTTQA